MRIENHPILGPLEKKAVLRITLDGKPVIAREGETIAAALVAAGVKTFRKTERFQENRGLYCAIGRCTDCIMTVDKIPNVRTCVTKVREGMVVQSQEGLVKWEGYQDEKKEL